ncbi:thiol-disulfide oxidoreductase DCC family protein [Bacillus marasmi]|uniref:thiol-disulfide oxidoreductase DCC family protein n=1 Tax=Bacillus marasmi TaxID=1926279 RepID=UPI0011CB5BC6|nr:thiol-disulfide oxidoreductase DCC family protein [Bacillus marasmi]
MQKIILFDGACNFCDSIVRFIINRDPKGIFVFASLQSDIGKELLNAYKLPKNINSFVLIKDNRCYIKSTAALLVCKNLIGAWKILYMLLIVPKPFRDYLYTIIANNRYKWFGKKEICEIPSPEIRKRFL